MIRPNQHFPSLSKKKKKKVFLFSVKTEKRKKSVLSHKVEAFARNAERHVSRKTKLGTADDVGTLQWCGP